MCLNDGSFDISLMVEMNVWCSVAVWLLLAGPKTYVDDLATGIFIRNQFIRYQTLRASKIKKLWAEYIIFRRNYQKIFRGGFSSANPLSIPLLVSLVYIDCIGLQAKAEGGTIFAS